MTEEYESTNPRVQVPYHSWIWENLVERGWVTMYVTPSQICKPKQGKSRKSL